MNAPNILLIVSDQERQRDWHPAGFELPARQRLIDGGLEFTRYYTHTSPCSPARGTLFTGQYLPVHGVTENCVMPANGELSTDAQTLGKLFRDKGYYTGYKGKWHLAPDAHPNMDAYGFSDWEGNDKAFWGQAGSGVEFDEPIAGSAAQWIRDRDGSTQPWFLSVGLVNPHDIMWFPMDQPWYQEENHEKVAALKERYVTMDWGRANPLPAFELPYEEWTTELPANFDDDLHTKPDVHRGFMREMSKSNGWLDHDDHRHWLRLIDYYLKLHQMSDKSLALILDALDETDGWDNTVVIFTADHGDQTGSHGLRSKGPWNYEETMRIPLYVVAPGHTTAGTTTNSMMSPVDLAATICDLGGIGPADAALPGRSMLPLWSDPSLAGRDHVLFAQDWAWFDGLVNSRYASRGIFDGRFKYCRYYGVGGSSTTRGTPIEGPKLYPADADFDDQEHEFYDLQEDPGELVNLAMDPARRADVREWYGRLLEAEAAEFRGPAVVFGTMLRPPPFPISIDQLTVDTLSDGMGAEVTGFSANQIGADRGMLGEIFIIDLSYAPEASGPQQVVAKFAALREGSLGSARRGRAHERELRCFDELLGDTPVSTPTNYGTWYDPDTAHFLLLQSAVPADHDVDQVVGLELADARLVLVEVAKLHARWWNDPELHALDWLPRLDGAGRVHNLTTLATAGWEPLCDMLGDELTREEQALGAQFPERIEATLRSVAALPSTLIHSDLRADNLLFAPDHSGVTLIDWQGCGLGPPGFDLAYFLTQSLSVASRREHEDALLEFYRTELAAAGLALSAAEVRAGYAESMIYGLSIACALPLISDPGEPRVKALASVFARRTIEAMRDHNQLWDAAP